MYDANNKIAPTNQLAGKNSNISRFVAQNPARHSKSSSSDLAKTRPNPARGRPDPAKTRPTSGQTKPSQATNQSHL
jgi:hypothetical protein